jgi:hypothetical protein
MDQFCADHLLDHMKSIISLTAMTILLSSCNNKNQDPNFRAEKVTRSATIQLNGGIDKVFLLFGAFEERKWAEGWNPTLIYPEREVIEEGTTFTTPGHGHDEKEYLWRVSRFEPEHYRIQYVVSSKNRWWIITVNCSPLTEKITRANITYTFVGLNSLGNKINTTSLERMFKYELRDWEEAINYFLTHDKMLRK